MRLIILLLLCIQSLATLAQLSADYLVTVHKQTDFELLYNQIKTQKLHPEQRAKLVLNVLTNDSKKAESAFGEELKTLESEGKILILNKFWLLNSWIVTCTPEVAEELRTKVWVESVVRTDRMYVRGIGPVKMDTGPQPRSTTGAEPGLVAVNARGMWELGYTGRGTRLLSFDTGVWTEHPALGNRFMGEYKPLAQSWRGFFSSTPIDKANSHGTHTIGTMAGLDTATNDTIGLAFHAYFIATDPIVANPADVLPFTDLINAYQWALNPDGDVNTTDDIPHVICNSWGFPGGQDSAYCQSFVSDMLNLIEMTGIAAEFSAGNEGPGDSTIGTPAFVSPSLVNAFSVGAVNGNNPTYPIASFSSRGPSVCSIGGVQQIKPEVVAPGVGVRSCIGTSSYASYDGTSMAGPHVAGALLLLREAYPTVPPEELKMALYLSATDLGIPGEDNTYGNGIINVRAAYDYLTQSYTPVPPNQSMYDISIISIDTPGSDFGCDPVLNPVFTIRNNGTQPINGVTYTARIVGTSESYSETNPSLVLAPGAVLQVTLPASLNNQPGYNELQVGVYPLEQITELDDINNTRMRRYSYLSEYTVQYFEGFENGTIQQNGWYVSNPDNSRTWDTAAVGGLPGSTTAAVMRCTGYAPLAGQLDNLVSPRIQMPAGNNLHLAFDLAYQYKSSVQNDSLFIFVSTDCGATFTDRIYAKGRDSLATITGNTIQVFRPTESAHWKHQEISLDAYAGVQDLIFSFTSRNRSGGNIFIDNVFVYQGDAPVSTQLNSLNDLTLFPNPVEDKLFIRSESLPGTKWSLCDITGRQVSAGNWNGILETLDFSGLARGIYILNIRQGSETMSRKIVY